MMAMVVELAGAEWARSRMAFSYWCSEVCTSRPVHRCNIVGTGSGVPPSKACVATALRLCVSVWLENPAGYARRLHRRRRMDADSSAFSPSASPIWAPESWASWCFDYSQPGRRARNQDVPACAPKAAYGHSLNQLRFHASSPRPVGTAWHLSGMAAMVSWPSKARCPDLLGTD